MPWGDVELKNLMSCSGFFFAIFGSITCFGIFQNTKMIQNDTDAWSLFAYFFFTLPTKFWKL